MHDQHWGVDIRVDGVRVLTIESACLSGLDDIEKYREIILGCAHHLFAFIGDGKPDNTFELGTTPNTGSTQEDCLTCVKNGCHLQFNKSCSSYKRSEYRSQSSSAHA